MEGVFPHIIAVMPVSLIQPYHGQNLRPEYPQHIRISPQYLCRLLSGQQPGQFRLNPFRCDFRQ